MIHPASKTLRKIRLHIGLWGVLLLQFSAAIADPVSDYTSLVNKAKQGDSDVDFAAMRAAYAMLPDYDPYGGKTDSLMKAGMSAFRADNCKAALENFQSAIALNFTISDAHAVMAECLKRSGDERGGEREIAITRGLLDSVLASGDGRSVETAFHVTHFYEEQLILRLSKLRETGQALLNVKTSAVDKITAINDKGEQRILYFDVAPLLEGTARQTRSGHKQ